MTTTSHRLAGALAAVIALGLAAPAEAKCPPGQAKKGNCTAAQAHQGPGKSHKNKAHKSSEKKHDKARPAQRAAVRPQHAVPVIAVGSAAAAAAAASKTHPVISDILYDDGRVAVGDSLGISRYRRVSDPLLFGLPVRDDGLAYYRVGDRIVLADPRDYRVREVALRDGSARFCPPGLAKKEPACIPPGQVDKIMRTEWDDRRFTPITDYARYGLPAPRDDWGYYVVDNTIVRADRQSHQILSLVRLIDAIL